MENTNPIGREPLLIVEICLCVPFSNATLERFFCHINIQPKTRNQLSQSSLNAVLCIRMFSMPLAEFSQAYVEDCITCWCNTKERRLGQQKRRAYSKRKTTLKKRKTFDIRELSSESTSEKPESDSVSNETDDEFW